VERTDLNSGNELKALVYEANKLTKNVAKSVPKIGIVKEEGK